MRKLIIYRGGSYSDNWDMSAFILDDEKGYLNLISKGSYALGEKLSKSVKQEIEKMLEEKMYNGGKIFIFNPDNESDMESFTNQFYADFITDIGVVAHKLGSDIYSKCPFCNKKTPLNEAVVLTEAHEQDWGCDDCTIFCEGCMRVVPKKLNGKDNCVRVVEGRDEYMCLQCNEEE